MAGRLNGHSCGACEQFLLPNFQDAYVRWRLCSEEVREGASRGCDFLTWALDLQSNDVYSRLRLSRYSDGRGYEDLIEIRWEEPRKSPIPDRKGRTAVLCSESSSTVLPPSLNPGSSANFVLARSWLDYCVHNHPDCNAAQIAKELPGRLLELTSSGDKTSLKLVHTANLGPTPIHATSEAAWLTEIDFFKLPQTIKDAIRVTRELGLSYVWIDALCILQDDDNDKRKEIGRMAKIYAQAHVTITASSASAVQDGFLASAPDDDSTPRFVLRMKQDDGKDSLVMLAVHQGLDDAYLWSEPLDGRGWTLQEEVLATRRLQFGTHQIRWSCRTVPDDPSKVNGWFKKRYMYENDGFLFSAGTLLSNRTLMDHKDWQQVVEVYSARQLSVEQDKLLAVSAIAELYNAHTGAEYIAGLWKQDIVKGLAWFPTYRYPRPKKPSQYICPSWSWAAIDGAASYHKDFEPVADVEGVHVELASSLKFGAVKSGSIRLRAHCLEISLCIANDPDSSVNDTGKPVHIQTFDTAGDAPALLLLLGSTWDGDCGFFLILQQDADSVWRRLGCEVLGLRNDGNIKTALIAAGRANGKRLSIADWPERVIEIL